MTPGRELDALIAQKVMGWRLERTACIDGCRMAWSKPRESGAFEMVGCDHSLPAFSTSIEAAWEVVEKMGDLGCDGFEVSFLDQRFSGNGFRRVCFSRLINGSRKYYVGQSQQIPHAICEAALKVLGHENLPHEGAD